MVKLKKIKLDKINDFLGKLPRNLAERAFSTFLKNFLIALIFAGIVFYQYVVLVQKYQPEIKEKPLQFKEKTYDNVLKIWQEREEETKQIDLKQYQNPFIK